MAGKNDYPGAAEFVPAPDASLPAVARAVQDCRGCDLYERATQAVFGDGSPDAAVVLIGEQPGDAEDRAGRPFAGPAGQLLDRALADAKIPPEIIYRTKRGQALPLAARPVRQEAPDPRAAGSPAGARLLALAGSGAGPAGPPGGGDAGRDGGPALLGSSFRVTSRRGTEICWCGPGPDGTEREITVVPTLHPSAVLRADDREAAYDGLVSDLQVAATCL